MNSLTEPLRAEHADLWPHIESLRAAADAIGGEPPLAVQAKVQQAYDFLRRHLIPHAEAEDEALYPAVQKAMGAPGATATMSRDHVEVGALTAQLAAALAKIEPGQISGDVARELRRTLYGLYALVHVHFAKEEEIYLPLLDKALSASEAKVMFADMEAAAGRAKRRSEGNP